MQTILSMRKTITKAQNIGPQSLKIRIQNAMIIHLCSPVRAREGGKIVELSNVHKPRSWKLGYLTTEAEPLFQCPALNKEKKLNLQRIVKIYCCPGKYLYPEWPRGVIRLLISILMMTTQMSLTSQ